MSWHKADWDAAGAKFTAWAKANPVALAIIVTAIVALLIGKFVL